MNTAQYVDTFGFQQISDFLELEAGQEIIQQTEAAYEFADRYLMIHACEDGSGFPFYKFVDAKNQQEFDEYVSKCEELALYETGISAEYEGELITLSTCEYTKKMEDW